jgi:FkbM family methyltransferase
MTRIDRLSQHSFVASALAPGARVLDLGANRGAFSLAVLAAYPVEVVALEPVHALSRTIPAQPGLTVLNAAVARETGTCAVAEDHADPLSSSVVGAVNEAKKNGPTQVHLADVPAFTLPDLLAHIGWDTVDLVKMDVEGAELDVLESAPSEVLVRCGQITIEFHDFWYPALQARTEACCRRMRSLGFWECRFTPNTKDVLFVNPTRVPLSGLERAYIRVVRRNIMGAGRALRLVGRAVWRT